MNNIALELLSAGVIAAFVTGIFSLIIAIKNNRKLVDLENSKQAFTMNQERYKSLEKAYNELYEALAEENQVGHFIMNLPLKKDFYINGLTEAFPIAENSMKIMYPHFQKYSYLFTKADQDTVIDKVEKIDFFMKAIVNKSADVKVFDTMSTSSDSEDMANWILKISEFEEHYFKLYRDNLSELCKNS